MLFWPSSVRPLFCSYILTCISKNVKYGDKLGYLLIFRNEHSFKTQAKESLASSLEPYDENLAVKCRVMITFIRI